MRALLFLYRWRNEDIKNLHNLLNGGIDLLTIISRSMPIVVVIKKWKDLILEMCCNMKARSSLFHIMEHLIHWNINIYLWFCRKWKTVLINQAGILTFSHSNIYFDMFPGNNKPQNCALKKGVHPEYKWLLSNIHKQSLLTVPKRESPE